MSAEPEPFLLGQVVLTVELDSEGNRLFGMNIETSPGERTKLYDVSAMIGLAMTNITDPEWRDLAYAEPDDE